MASVQDSQSTETEPGKTTMEPLPSACSAASQLAASQTPASSSETPILAAQEADPTTESRERSRTFIDYDPGLDCKDGHDGVSRRDFALQEERSLHTPNKGYEERSSEDDHKPPLLFQYPKKYGGKIFNARDFSAYWRRTDLVPGQIDPDIPYCRAIHYNAAKEQELKDEREKLIAEKSTAALIRESDKKDRVWEETRTASAKRECEAAMDALYKRILLE